GGHAGGLDDYTIEARYGEHVDVQDDPYRFTPTVGDLDLYLLGEGRHERLWDVLGANVRDHAGTRSTSRGTAFAVWAPHARAVRVTGSFNDWDGSRHAMRRLNGQGVWELFVPGVEAGAVYKFQILTQHGAWIDKADPVAKHAERPPHTASVVAAPAAHEWGDGAWMRRRAETDPHTAPMSVYELHALSWRPGLGYRELADELVTYLDELGFTHVEFMPLAEHPYGPSWGYQVTGYYAPTSRLGSPDDLRYLIDRLHQAGYGVIMDWVPGHFPKDAFALGRFDGEPLYEHGDPRLGEQPDWGTYVFNFGDSQVRNFLVANALYWLDEFHIDGLRVDAVASMLYLDYSRDEWVPNIHGGRENLEAIAFLQEACATAYREHPGTVMIAEESTSFDGVTRPTSQGGLGFGLKWNMGWMNDNLRYFERDPLYRGYHHGELTFSYVYAW
ncbi:MAG: 1,4-alpha-glucan branching enzyme, partial [Pseudoclavibacter sp.]